MNNGKVLYKSMFALTIILTLCFGQALFCAVSEFIPSELLKALIRDGAPAVGSAVKSDSRLLESFFGLEIISPEKLIENQPVVAENIKEEAAKASKLPEVTVTEKTVATSAAAAYNTASGVEVRNATDYSFDKEKLINERLGFTVSDRLPSVLIIHTHTSEAYLPVDTPDFVQSDPHRTQNPRYNVVRVGEEFKHALEGEGIIAVHDTTVHDYPSYNGSYVNALKTIEANLKKYPSVKMVIDIHRDAIEKDGVAVKLAADIEGIKTAQVMIVTGSDANGIPHPNWRENLKFSLKYQRRLNLLYPKLARPVDLCRERYNTHTTAASIILEIGTTGNTLDEAINAARCSGKALGNMLSYIKASE